MQRKHAGREQLLTCSDYFAQHEFCNVQGPRGTVAAVQRVDVLLLVQEDLKRRAQAVAGSWMSMHHILLFKNVHAVVPRALLSILAQPDGR